MMPRMIVIIIALDAVLLGAATTVHAQEVDDITLEDIWAAFRARQEQARTARVTWNQRLLKTEYAVTDVLEHEQEDPTDAADIVFPEHAAELVLSGERVRYESLAASFAGGQGGRPAPVIWAYDGVDDQSFGASTRHDRPHHGTIKETDAFLLWDMIHLRGVMFALRPLRPELCGPDASQWRIVDIPNVIDGGQCVVIERPIPVTPANTVEWGEVVERNYLDPEHGFRLVRYTYSSERGYGGPIMQIDAKYEHSDDANLVPSTWHASIYGAKSGRLLESSENRLSSVEIGAAIADEEFRIQFPEGTHVQLISNPYEGQLFVAEADGTLVPASPRQRINPAPRQSAAQWDSQILIFVGVLALLLIIGWGLWRKYRTT